MKHSAHVKTHPAIFLNCYRSCVIHHPPLSGPVQKRFFFFINVPLVRLKLCNYGGALCVYVLQLTLQLISELICTHHRLSRSPAMIKLRCVTKGAAGI